MFDFAEGARKYRILARERKTMRRGAGGGGGGARVGKGKPKTKLEKLLGV